MNKNKGSILLIVIAILAIGGGVFIYNKKGSFDTSKTIKIDKQENNEKCKTDGSETALLCDLSTAYSYGVNGKTAVIRLQGTLSNYYTKNKQDLNLLMSEIKNNTRPLEYRIFLIKILSTDKDNFSLIRKDLLSVISDRKNADEIRAQMIITSPKIYSSIYHTTRVRDNNDLFETLISILNENNEKLSSAVINSMFGYMANLDEQRAVDVIVDFASDYKNNYRNTPNTLAESLLILKNSKKLTPLTTEAIKYVCDKNDSKNLLLCR